MGRTGIEWTEVTWNPVTGCDRVSPGCDHCYALTLAGRLKAMGNRRYQRDGSALTSGPGFGMTLHEDKVSEPLTWRKPRMVFVNSMSDLFHDRVPVVFIQRVFEVMAATPHHTYQVLTKRSARLVRVAPELVWPANVWMGVTVESQDYVIRAHRLSRAVGPQVTFISAEPLIGPVEFEPNLLRGIDWLIAGGESGANCRPCETAWLRSLRGQCARSGTAFFLKQLGGHPDKRGKDKALLDGQRWLETPLAIAKSA